MNIFTILAVCVFLAVGLGSLVAIAVVLLGARKRGLRLTLFRLAVCCIPMAAFHLLYAWFFGPADYSSPGDLAAAYRTEFGVSPPADVTDIRARQIVVGDAGAAWLRFCASSQTIDLLLARFVPSDRLTFSQACAGGNVPSWWAPEEDRVETFYTADHWSRSFSRSKAYIGIDRDRHIVYFHHSGND